MNNTVVNSNRALTLSSAERIELAEYMRFAHESIVATINDARSSKRTGALLLADLQRYADNAAALASRLAR